MRLSSRFSAWKVTCRQQLPMPKPIASMWMFDRSCVAVSRNFGTWMFTFSPRRARMLRVSALEVRWSLQLYAKRGKGLMMVSGT